MFSYGFLESDGMHSTNLVQITHGSLCKNRYPYINPSVYLLYAVHVMTEVTVLDVAYESRLASLVIDWAVAV